MCGARYYTYFYKYIYIRNRPVSPDARTAERAVLTQTWSLMVLQPGDFNPFLPADWQIRDDLDFFSTVNPNTSTAHAMGPPSTASNSDRRALCDGRVKS
ncbi:hypothetical protein EMIHUDRAFT_245006 [Emiliania huxleyi CCMP1516]|uniref:Uncharacterized protein n=2 Tax=Emiliania huxleyi TaxID=2903 RepID=A0A0D3IZ53_EMIH1|nr:hypothetical protein EMIHUDRAFT_245006 [Emiliania huxleyi CCMP1516]EOD16538.1 hypothetical protein EMIHUDRAFT_245006 [Emiliania huxleyi CCMP1516]|eukprot:XP_005768967.1 hypothetical protein EMIHUDRAFT_245006 [Emiliania huxleyi CCMP1516]